MFAVGMDNGFNRFVYQPYFKVKAEIITKGNNYQYLSKWKYKCCTKLTPKFGSLYFIKF